MLRFFGLSKRRRGSPPLRPAIQCVLAQIDAALEGSRLAASALAGESKASHALSAMGDVEKRGDECRRQLISELARSFSEPIDHEDLFRLSRSVDDVLDSLWEFLREYHLYPSVGGDALVEMLSRITDAMEHLRLAVRSLGAGSREVAERSWQAQQRASLVRRAYQDRVADLLATGQVTPAVLGERELLRRLDVAGLRLQEGIAALTDGLIKRDLTWSADPGTADTAKSKT